MPIFQGKVTIRVKFRNRIEYEKFRTIVLKTSWNYALDYPLFEEMNQDFHNVEELEKINKVVIWLLQLGFEVYCCRYQLEEHLAELEHPTEEDPVEVEDDDIQEIVDDLWRRAAKGEKVTV